MRDCTIRDIIDLVVAEVPEPEARLEKMFEWHFQRVQTIAHWFLTTTAALLVAVLVGAFGADWQLSLWQTGLILLCAIATASYGLYLLWKLRALAAQFVASLKLLSEFRSIRPFLLRYRNERR